MAERWDVVVVGAGPAGSAAALAALQAWPRARVLLLDRAGFPRDKVCGDGVAPQVFDVLAGLGVRDADRGYPGVHHLHLGLPDGPRARGAMRRPARVVPREVLDTRLVDAAAARGAHVRRQRVREVHLLPDGVELGAGVVASVVVGADGAQSAVARALGVRHPGAHTAIALRGYAPVRPEWEREQVIVFPRGPLPGAGWPAYAWSFPIGDGRANVGYGELLPRGGRPGPTRAALLDRLEALLPGVGYGAADWRGHHLPLSSGRARPGDGQVLLAGDALGLVNPLTGEGIHAAVVSGALAGRCAVAAVRAGRPDGAGRTYRAALRSRLGRHLRDIGLAARLAAVPRVVVAGVEAAAGDRAVFDTLVDLGLADGRLDARTVRRLARALV